MPSGTPPSDRRDWRAAKPLRYLEYYGRRLQKLLSNTVRTPRLAKPLRLPAVDRQPQADGVGIVAIAKDEGPYIREWVEFHARAGFQRFYVYDNGSTDNTRDELADLARDLDVTVIPWRTFEARRDAQFLAYNHAVAQFYGANKWLAFIDIDEFLFALDGRPMSECLAAYDDVPAVSVPWVMYGTSGHECPPPGRVTESYLMRAPFPPPIHKNTLMNYKTIVRPAFVDSMTVHFPRLKGEPSVFYNERKERLHKAAFIDPAYAHSDIFRLNHYFTKSQEEINGKIARGPISPRKRTWRKTDRYLTIEDETVFDAAATRIWALPDNAARTLPQTRR